MRIKRVKINLTREEINALQYPVVVEKWEKMSTNMNRQYNKRFTTEERRKNYNFYLKFYRWHLVTGTPEEIDLFPEDLVLMKQFIDFIATVESDYSIKDIYSYGGGKPRPLTKQDMEDREVFMRDVL